MHSLFVIQGRDQGQRFLLEEQEILIGRVAGNSIQLHDTEISRKHAILQDTNSGYTLRDLNSSNGTFVNGKAIKEKRLESGDRIQIGRTLLLYTGAHHDDDTSGEVSIVTGADQDNESRILHAISQTEGADLLGTPANQTQSPWLAKARSNLQLMYRTSLAISHTLDIDQLLSRIMDMIFEWVDADRGCIMLKNEETGLLEAKVRRGRRGTIVGNENSNASEETNDSSPIDSTVRINISKTILDYVMDRCEGVLTSNAGDDERWDPAKSIMRMGINEAICVPMQGRYGLVGVIYIDTSISIQQLVAQKSANKFGEEHLKLMVAIAHQAALAVEDTSHYQARVQAERLAAVGQTIATLSHHIKNILQGVRGGSYLIELGLGDHLKALNPDGEAEAGEQDIEAAIAAVKTVNKGWGIVEKNQERISSLVMDMLTYSKEREPELDAANLNETVSDVVELMQIRAAESGVQLIWSPNEDLPRMMIDSESIHRAVLNIVGNAIDACEGRNAARVNVSTSVIQSTEEPIKLAQVVVNDTGIGIEEEKIKTIFNAFVSGKGAKGTGLGLAVTRKIAEEHNGTVHVASQVGTGSTFVFEIPLIVATKQNEKEDFLAEMPEEIRATYVQQDEEPN